MPLPAAKQRNKQRGGKRNRDMATIDYLFCDWSQIGVREMSYDEFCIAAFGKDAEDLRERENSLKTERNEQCT